MLHPPAITPWSTDTQRQVFVAVLFGSFMLTSVLFLYVSEVLTGQSTFHGGHHKLSFSNNIRRYLHNTRHNSKDFPRGSKHSRHNLDEMESKGGEGEDVVSPYQTLALDVSSTRVWYGETNTSSARVWLGETEGSSNEKPSDGFPDVCRGPLAKKQNRPVKDFDLRRYGPFKFLDNFKTPCWLKTTTSTDSNPTAESLACLPYFYIAGFNKCGTTDLYRRILLHPQAVPAPEKETHWVTRLRFAGKEKFWPYNLKIYKNYREWAARLKHAEDPETEWLNFYTSFFASPILQARSASLDYTHLIVGDASASTVWDNHNWQRFPGNENCTEPRVLNADYIRHINPRAKIIIMLRNPTTRIYSQYMFELERHKLNPTKEKFHRMATGSIGVLAGCLKKHTARHCLYNNAYHSMLGVEHGLYYVFVQDWLLRFPRDQVLILRLEDMAADLEGEMLRVFDFLELDRPDEATMKAILSAPKTNAGTTAAQVGPMLNETKSIIDNFYRPYNERLAELLGDEKYLWRDDESAK